MTQPPVSPPGSASGLLRRVALGTSLMAAMFGVMELGGSAPSAAPSMILLRAAWCFQIGSPHSPLSRATSIVVFVIVCLSALRGLAFFGELPFLGWLPGGDLLAPRLSPMTLASVLLLGVALLLWQARSLRANNAVGGIALAVVALNFILVLGYAYGSPLLSGAAMVSVTLQNVVAFLGLGIGVIAAAGTERFPLAPLVGTSTRARLLRGFLPLCLVALAADSVARLLLPIVLPLHPALLSVMSMLVLMAAISATVSQMAVWIGGTIDRVETERHHAVEALHASEAKFRALVEHSLVGIYLLQKDRLVYVNPRLAEMFGYPQQQLMQSTSMLDLIIEADRILVADNLLKPLQGQGESVRYTCRGQRADGTVIDIEVHGTRTEVHGSPAIIGTLLDMTDTMRLERERQEQSEVLEHSNLELVQQQKVMQSLLEDLQQSKEHLAEQGRELEARNTRLKALMELKDEFVAKVSHELRTPLTSIKEGVSLMLDRALGETTAEQQDFLKTIDADIDRLTELINNMLDLSKIEAGRMRLSRRLVDLRAIINGLVRSCQPMLGHRRVHIACTENPPVFADPNGMLQILTNLFSNALKFTPDDGRITFRILRREAMVAVAVEDTGPGIAQDDLPKLFQKFCGVETQGSARRGTGLGLAVCKELTELHGGRIEVASELGRGTTFTVWMPLYTEAVALTWSFQDLLQRASSEGIEHVALMAIQGRGPTASSASPPSRLALERLAEVIRQHVHRGDVVLVLPPDHVVVLAAADALAVRAMIKRLQGVLPAESLRCGIAICPTDGTEVHALLKLATSRVGMASAVRWPPESSAPLDTGPLEHRHHHGTPS